MLGMLCPSVRNATTKDRRRYPLASDCRRRIVLTSWTVPGSSSSPRIAFHSPPVLTGEADFGDALREEPLAFRVLPQHGLQLVERLQHVVGPGPAPVVSLVRH